MCKNKHTRFVLKIINLIIVLCIYASINNYAQDIHFSQIKSTPLFLNPANTGTSMSDLRFTNDYRSQWYKIDNPYNSLMLGLDTRFSVFKRRFGIGGILVHDQSLSNYLNVDKAYFSFSHSFFYKNHQIAIGLQPGFVLKKLNDNILTFGNQFDPNNPGFDPSLPSNENGINEAFSYFDLNVGFLWQSRIKSFISSVGVGVNHINRPVESFYADSATAPLALQTNLHGNIFIPITKKYAIEPQALYSYTKGSKEFVGGVLFNYFPLDNNSGFRKFYGISELRINPVKNFDALILGAGIEIAGFDFCFTYDINVSSLREFSRYQGAYEISLVYYVNWNRSASRAEPCFML